MRRAYWNHLMRNQFGACLLVARSLNAPPEATSKHRIGGQCDYLGGAWAFDGALTDSAIAFAFEIV